jgi:hypothetical protein
MRYLACSHLIHQIGGALIALRRSTPLKNDSDMHLQLDLPMQMRERLDADETDDPPSRRPSISSLRMLEFIRKLVVRTRPHGNDEEISRAPSASGHLPNGKGPVDLWSSGFDGLGRRSDWLTRSQAAKRADSISAIGRGAGIDWQVDPEQQIKCGLKGCELFAGRLHICASPWMCLVD